MSNYKSLFSKAGIISKLELCEMLGLNTSRTPLNFTASEINKAFKKRALRIHPDKQAFQQIKIPAELCNTLLSDVTRARDHLLKGEENIPGSGIDELITSPVLRTAVSKMSQFNPKALADNIRCVALFAKFSLSIIPLSILFSQFTIDHQLYIRYVNFLPKDRSLLKSFDPKFVTSFLQAVKHICETSELPDKQDLMNRIQEMAATQSFLNELPGAFNDPALHAVLQYYKPLLEDDVIEAMQTIATSIHQFLTDIPTYSHIIGTYLSSMIFTTDRLIKIIAVYRDLVYVVSEQKNTFDAVKIYASILVLSLVMLPLNIAASIINAEIYLNLLFLTSGYVVADSAFQLVWALYLVVADVRNNGVTQSNFGQLLKDVITFAWNISVRYPLEIAIGVIDNLIYWLGGQRVLQSKMNEVVDYLDELHGYWFPKSIHAVNVNHQKETALTVVSGQHHVEHVPRSDEQPVVPEASSSFLSENDTWLQGILNLVQEQSTADDLGEVQQPAQQSSASVLFFRRSEVAQSDNFETEDEAQYLGMEKN